MKASDRKATTVQYAMNTAPSEYGRDGAEGLRDLVKRATAHAPLATYAEDAAPPISWSAITAAGWDLAGVVDDDGDGPNCRDLVEMARVWGFGCIPQPLLPTIMCKRLSTVAREANGPVTFAVPFGDAALVPFGTTCDIAVLTSLGDDAGTLTPVPVGYVDGLDLVSRGVRVSQSGTMTREAAREVALVFAAECVGGAERLLTDTLTYVSDREQFGRPVGSFQAVKHMLATATVALESADTAVVWGTQRDADALRCAVFAVERCIDVAEIAIQAHGGLGFTWEAGLHFPLRRMLSTRRWTDSLRSQFEEPSSSADHTSIDSSAVD